MDGFPLELKNVKWKLYFAQILIENNKLFVGIKLCLVIKLDIILFQ